MKIISRIIFFLIMIIKIFCIDIDSILNDAYSKLSQLPTGSTIYYSKSIKCASYNQTSIICLINESLYKIGNNQEYILLLNISGYKDSFYYELNLYNDNNVHINCLITHFLNKNELIFKYYAINIYDNSISHSDFTYYNISLNPINKGINCHTRDGPNNFRFTCFYLNENKNVIQMEINAIEGTNRTNSSFKEAVIQNNEVLNNNTLIMSSLYKDKFKFFTCYQCTINDHITIYVKKQGNIDFNGFIGNLNNNNIQSYDFNCEDKDNMILFAVFKSICPIFPNTNCKDYKDNTNLKYVFCESNESNMRILQKRNEIDNPIGPFNMDLYLKKIDECGGNGLFFEEKENILFVQTNKNIKNFQFEENIENSYIISSINPSSVPEISNKIQNTIIPTYIHNTEKITLPETETQKKEVRTEEPETEVPKQKLTYNPTKKEKIKTLSLPKENMAKEDIMENIKNIMQETEIGETYEYEREDFTILIYPTNSDLLSKKTHIDFVECESILKTQYNLSNDSIITFFQMEISNKNQRSLTNQVEYQVFDEQKNPLDLSKCNNTNIKIFYGIKNNSDLDMSIIDSFKDTGVNVFNLSDEFFNDVCYPYSEGGNDLILEDRIKDIYQNYTLCEEGCTYDSIDIYNMLISCQCDVKENMTTVITEIKEEAAEKITSLNFEIIKCYNLAFSFKDKMKNIGFWILSVFLIFYILSFIIYCFKGITPIKEYIFKEMTKFGYINKGPYKLLKSKKTNKKSLFERAQITKKTNINNPPLKEKNPKKKTSQSKIILLGNKPKNSLINKIKISNKVMLNKDTQNQVQNLGLNLISINLNDLSQRDCYPKESNITLYNYTMEEAYKYDRRNILVIFYIYLLSKQAFFHAFLYRSPLVLFPLRFCLLLFIISSDLALNAFFYFNDNISRKYRYTKSLFIFAFSNNITVILLSTLVGFILLTLFTNLSNSTKAIRDVFKNEEKKIRKNKKYIVTPKRKDEIRKDIENILNKHKCKILILFSFEIILMIFYWYYVVVFCHVFSGTQTSWLIDSVLSMLSRFIIDVLFCLLFAKLYRIGVNSNYNCIYKIALFFYGFC